MPKDELRRKLDELKIPYTEKDGVEELKAKLQQAQLPKAIDPHLPFILFDAEDDEQILAEFQGVVLDKFVYSFPQDGKEVVGLSKAGVDQVCRQSADIKGEVYRSIEITTNQDGEYINVIVKAGRYKIGFKKDGEPYEMLMDTAVGSKRQWMKFRRRDGSINLDPFFYEKAVSKAQRNAKMSLLPYTFITEMVKMFKEKGNVQVIQANKKISEAQLRFIHGVGTECRLTHQEITNLLKTHFKYDTLNELEMSQVSAFVEVLKKNSKKIVPMPEEVKKLFGGMMTAKSEALWQKALTKASNDPKKAQEFIETGEIQ